jgi:hypothetical protein
MNSIVLRENILGVIVLVNKILTSHLTKCVCLCATKYLKCGI